MCILNEAMTWNQISLVWFALICCFVLAKALTDVDIKLILPKECEGITFCDVEPAEYPHLYFDEYVREMQRKHNFLQSLTAEGTPTADNIPQKFYDEENCSTETRILYPFIARPNTTTKLVMQSKYFKQKVTETICLNREPCLQSVKGLGYTSTCEEKYGEVQLYLFDPIKQRIVHEAVRVPVCCRCVTKREVAVCLFSETLTEPQNFREAKMPASCEGKNFCHKKSEDYPQELINKILEDLNHKIVESAYDYEAQDRYGQHDLDDDCKGKPEFEPIYEIIDNNDLVRYVIQSDTNFQQRVKTEICVNPGRLSTSKYFEEVALKYVNLSCIEKRMEYVFQVLALDGNSLESVLVKGGLPVCCSAHFSVS